MNATTPISIGDLIFFEDRLNPHMLILQRVANVVDNFALRDLSPSGLEDCRPPIDLFRRHHPSLHPTICLQTLEDNAELGKITRIIRSPDWSTLKGALS